MKFTSTLEINFLQQGKDSPSKTPIKFALTKLKNGSYALSDFSSYNDLHKALEDWLKEHTSENLEMSPTKLEKFIAFNKEIFEDNVTGCGCGFLDFPDEETSLIKIPSIKKEIDIDDSNDQDPQTKLCCLESMKAALGGIEETDSYKFEKMIFENGTAYEGFIQNKLPNGFGHFTYTSGNQYIGGQKDDAFNGIGCYYYKNGAFYFGEFVNDFREGWAECRFENGSRYVGKFKKNKREGLATTYYTSGIYKGYWENSQKHGNGIFTDEYGTETEQCWLEGKRIS